MSERPALVPIALVVIALAGVAAIVTLSGRTDSGSPTTTEITEAAEAEPEPAPTPVQPPTETMARPQAPPVMTPIEAARAEVAAAEASVADARAALDSAERAIDDLERDVEEVERFVQDLETQGEDPARFAYEGMAKLGPVIERYEQHLAEADAAEQRLLAAEARLETARASLASLGD